jgi:hypothetical protein
MNLVTIRKNWAEMDPKYTPGKCNIGTRGRTMRFSTGLILIALSVIIRLTLLNPVYWAVRLVLTLPIYAGLLAMLEGSMSFCVLHASRGTYDFHEPMGFASNTSKTLNKVQTDEWKRMDRSKALTMHSEAIVGAVALALLLAFA